MTKTTKQTKQAAKAAATTAKAAATTAKAAATIAKAVVAEVALTAADVYRELAADLDNAALRTAVASMLGPDHVGLDTNASWYRWDAKRQAARAARQAARAAASRKRS